MFLLLKEGILRPLFIQKGFAIKDIRYIAFIVVI